MRKKVDNFRENYGDTTRVVLFQLAALTADYFLLWPRRDATPVKTAINCVYSLLIHSAAYKAAKCLETPKVQSVNNTTDTAKDNKAVQTQEGHSALVGPATP